METKRILLSVMLGILLLAGVSFVSSVGISIAGLWSDGSTSTTITNGDTASFNYYFVTATTPLSMTIKLYDSSGKVMHTFLDTSTSNSYYYNDAPVSVTSSDYGGAGTYYLTFHANDTNGEYAKTITLTVNPAPNSPPTITSIPNQKVDEGSSYSYQVSASDPDGDKLTYSLSGAPAGFSISSSGKITGTAPSVSSDTDYTLVVSVSDGKNPAVSKSYTLTVDNVPAPAPTPDTTAPVITLGPITQNGIFNINNVTVTAHVLDNVAVANVSLLLNNTITQTDSSGLNDHNYTFQSTFLPDGNYTWAIKACDTSGNCATTDPVKFTIDTIVPTINFVNSTTAGNVSQNFIYVELNATDGLSGINNIGFSLYNSTGFVKVDSSLSSSLSTNVTGLADGTYFLNATATDNAGNSMQISREIILDTTPPTIQFVAPTPSDNQKLNQSYIPVNLTASDAGTGVKSVKVYLYSASGLEGSSSSNYFNFTGLPSGTYYINATAQDALGNVQKSQTITVILNSSIAQQSQTQNTISNYSYSDVYANQYNGQNNTNPGISLGGQPLPSVLNGSYWIWALIVGILAVVIACVGVVLGKTRFNEATHKSAEQSKNKPAK